MISKSVMLARVLKPIIASMKNGKLLWLRPWKQGAGGGLPYNPLRSGDAPAYKGGVNNLLLMISSMIADYSDPRWMGRGQLKKAGHSIKGLTNDKGTVIYAPLFRKVSNDDGEIIPIIRGFRECRVFNAEQVQGFPEIEENGSPLDTTSGFMRAQNLYDSIGIGRPEVGEIAAYYPAVDKIVMPPAQRFNSASAYWATLMHEVGHATGAEHRVNRSINTAKNSDDYAEEELVAELFAAFACSHVGIKKEEITENHAAYLQSWSKRIEKDGEVFLRAINAAWKAFDWAASQ